jgi:hypothetical protein
VTWGINKTHDSKEFAFTSTIGALGLSAVTHRWRTLRTFVKCSISITDLDGDPSS